MSDKVNAAFHPYASREEALEAEVRALRGRLDAVLAECDSIYADTRPRHPQLEDGAKGAAARIRRAANP